ncbi:hypothetical protein KAZ01_03255 [Candidatus Gracilibacteria bacterium]|nr:hypothetical protein [Candidatus Gracilibacteria bacterium]
MFGNEKYISDEEKIDYIYKSLKSQKRALWIKRILYLVFIGCLAWFYLKIVPTLDYKYLANKYIMPKFIPLVMDLSSEMTKGLQENMSKQLNNTIINQTSSNQITEDTIKKALEQIKNIPKQSDNTTNNQTSSNQITEDTIKKALEQIKK